MFLKEKKRKNKKGKNTKYDLENKKKKAGMKGVQMELKNSRKGEPGTVKRSHHCSTH